MNREIGDLVIEKVTIEFPKGTLPTTGGMMLANVRVSDLSKRVLDAIQWSEAMGD